MRIRHVVAFLLAVFVVLDPTLVSAQNSRSITNIWHIGGEGGWDYVTVDAPTHRVFVTRGTHTQVLDPDTHKVLADIPGQLHAHGVALAPSVGRGFISDGGGAGAIVVFDLKTYAVLGKLAAVPDVDGIIYDAALGRVFAGAGDANAVITFKADIDPASGKIDPPIDLGGAPEFLASDGSGKLFVNIVDKDLVAEVDVATRKVIARWPLVAGGHPTGLSIDKEHHRLFVGCRKPQKLIVMSTDEGKVLASLPIGTGVDATAYIDGRAFASCGDGTLTVVGEKSGSFEVEQVVKTQSGARTMGLDAGSHKIYLPTAEFEPQPPGATSRPKPKPDTFVLLEVDASK